MNKTVIINIAGSIFHIEEEAYSLVKEYDNSIREHFNNSPDGFEIVSDIENRIAELFSDKLKLTGRAVIELEDAKEVIARLGNVEDFTFGESEVEDHQSTDHRFTHESRTEVKRKLLRDPRHKMLGGVCAGIGVYLNVDATLIRLLWIFSLVFFGAGLLLYLLMCLIIPNAKDEEDFEMMDSRTQDTVFKRKLFRDVEHKAIAGVCSGIAAYFHVDVTWVRLLFVLFLLPIGFGFHHFWGIFSAPILAIYVILWMVVPEASTTSEKRAMKGEPETLDEIIRNVGKKTKGVKDAVASEAKGLGSSLFSFLEQFFLFVIKFAAKFSGVILLLLAISFSILIVGGLIVIANSNYVFNNYQFVTETFRVFLSLFLFLVFFIPTCCLFWAGLKLLVNVRAFSKTFVMVMVGVWIAALVAVFYMSVQIGLEFSEKASIEETLVLEPVKGPYYLTASMGQVSDSQIPNLVQKMNVGRNRARRTVTRISHIAQDLNKVFLRIEKSNDEQTRLVQCVTACGKTSEDAVNNAENIKYLFEQQDSTLHFDRKFQLMEQGLWRQQRVELVLQLPVNSIVVADEQACAMSRLNFWECRTNRSANTAIWLMTEDGLKCLSDLK